MFLNFKINRFLFFVVLFIIFVLFSSEKCSTGSKGKNNSSPDIFDSIQTVWLNHVKQRYVENSCYHSFQQSFLNRMQFSDDGQTLHTYIDGRLDKSSDMYLKKIFTGDSATYQDNRYPRNDYVISVANNLCTINGNEGELLRNDLTPSDRAWLEAVRRKELKGYSNSSVDDYQFSERGSVLTRADRVKHSVTSCYVFQKTLSPNQALYTQLNDSVLFKLKDNLLYMASAKDNFHKLGQLLSPDETPQAKKWLTSVSGKIYSYQLPLDTGKIQFSEDGKGLNIKIHAQIDDNDSYSFYNALNEFEAIYRTEVGAFDTLRVKNNVLSGYYSSPCVLRSIKKSQTKEALAWFKQVSNSVVPVYDKTQRTDSYKFSSDGILLTEQNDSLQWIFQKSFSSDSALYESVDGNYLVYSIHGHSLIVSDTLQSTPSRQIGTLYAERDTPEALDWFRAVQDKTVYKKIEDSPYATFYVFSDNGQHVTCMVLADGVKTESYTYAFQEAPSAKEAIYRNKGDVIADDNILNDICLEIVDDQIYRTNISLNSGVDADDNSEDNDDSDSDIDQDEKDSSVDNDADDGDEETTYSIGTISAERPDTLHAPAINYSKAEKDWLHKLSSIHLTRKNFDIGYDYFTISDGGRKLKHFSGDFGDIGSRYSYFTYWFTELLAPNRAKYICYNIRNDDLYECTVSLTDTKIVVHTTPPLLLGCYRNDEFDLETQSK